MEDNVRFSFISSLGYEKVIFYPIFYAGITALYGFLFYAGGLYVKIILTLIFIKFIHYMINNSVKFYAFLDDSIEIHFVTGKKFNVPYDKISSIESIKYNVYDLRRSHVVFYRKGAMNRKGINFYCPEDQIEPLIEFLKTKGIRYKNVGWIGFRE